MAKHLDLEEQEQLDQLKHFWQQYGNLISWVLIAILGSFAGWNFYQYWQRNQAAQAAVMYDEVERVARAGDMDKLGRVLADMKDKYSSTMYAQQAGLIAAKVYHDAGNTESAKTALSWVADQSSDAGYQAIAKLRLAGVLIESKAYDEALQHLSGSFPTEYLALVADRRGDIYQLQGKKAEAVAEYTKAFNGLDARTEYRALVEVKLNALGSNPRGAEAVAAQGSAGEGVGK